MFVYNFDKLIFCANLTSHYYFGQGIFTNLISLVSNLTIFLQVAR